jgi:hypothetical protein
VRTTLTLDQDVATRLKAEASRSGRPFKDVVNECLRSGLAQRQASSATQSFRVKPRDFGVVQPGISLDNVEELLERIEGPGAS